MRFAIIVTAGAHQALTPPLIGRWIAAYELRGAEMSADWAGDPAGVETCQIRGLTSARHADADEVCVLLQPTIDEPDDAAYHSVRGGQPFAIVLASPATSIAEISIATLHEILETMADPSCTGYRAGVALEVCDPVQGVAQPIVIGDGQEDVPAEAYVTPRWFELDADPATTCSVGRRLARSLAPGGYVQHEDGTQTVGSPAARAALARKGPHSRYRRRTHRAVHPPVCLTCHGSGYVETAPGARGGLDILGVATCPGCGGKRSSSR